MDALLWARSARVMMPYLSPLCRWQIGEADCCRVDGISAPSDGDWGFSTINGNAKRGNGILNSEKCVLCRFRWRYRPKKESRPWGRLSETPLKIRGLSWLRGPATISNCYSKRSLKTRPTQIGRHIARAIEPRCIVDSKKTQCRIQMKTVHGGPGWSRSEAPLKERGHYCRQPARDGSEFRRCGRGG